jgi:hypothetical protein
MEAIFEEHEKLSAKHNLARSVEDVQKTIDLLTKAREAIAANHNSASITLAKLQNPVKQSFDAIKSDLQEVYNGLGNYSKVLEKKFKDKPLPTTDYDALSSHPRLINRAISMHLLREGQFAVASAFLAEDKAYSFLCMPESEPSTPESDSEEELEIDPVKSGLLREQFTSMYHILHELKNKRNLLPAIAWAKTNSAALESRGSNLEFELGRLQFIWLFSGGSLPNDSRGALEGRQLALDYARKEFGHFQARYLREIQQLG